MLPQIFNKQKQTKKYKQPHQSRHRNNFLPQQHTVTKQNVTTNTHIFSQNPYNQVNVRNL